MVIKKKYKDKIDICDYESVKNNKICLISPNNIFNDLSNGEESDEEKNIEIKCSPEKENKTDNDFVIINNINNINDDDNNKNEEKEKEKENDNKIECSNEDNNNIINDDDDEVIIKCDSESDNDSNNKITHKSNNDFEIY